jgi:hypothetical protein
VTDNLIILSLLVAFFIVATAAFLTEPGPDTFLGKVIHFLNGL